MRISRASYIIDTGKTIGSGGFGRVDEVDLYNQSRHCCGKYAIKIFAPADAAHASEYLPRFIKEVEYQAGCAHENIAQIYMHNLSANPWFLMDLADCDLQDEMNANTLGDPEKIEIVKMLLQGVKYMHGKKLLHRDIKPKNILKFSSPLGVKYKLSDFGLAKNVDPKKTSEVLTKIAVAMGTEEYMAPESSAAGEYSEKSDIYSLGVVFEKLGYSEKWLGKIVDKCTNRRPTSRYDSVGEIYQEIINSARGN